VAYHTRESFRCMQYIVRDRRFKGCDEHVLQLSLNIGNTSWRLHISHLVLNLGDTLYVNVENSRCETLCRRKLCYRATMGFCAMWYITRKLFLEWCDVSRWMKLIYHVKIIFCCKAKRLCSRYDWILWNIELKPATSPSMRTCKI
jgi:hypothetical protein